jgi:formylglycine-generating enzyme required for sulfatase activity
MWKAIAFIVCVLDVLLLASPSSNTNSIGMTFVRIRAGSFEMGVDSVPLPAVLLKAPSRVIYDRRSDAGDYDEVPVHKVTITHPFWVGVTEVRIRQSATSTQRHCDSGVSRDTLRPVSGLRAFWVLPQTFTPR